MVDLKGCKIDSFGYLDKKKTVFAIIKNQELVILLQAGSESEMQSWANMILEIPGTKKEKVTHSTFDINN